MIKGLISALDKDIAVPFWAQIIMHTGFIIGVVFIARIFIAGGLC